MASGSGMGRLSMVTTEHPRAASACTVARPIEPDALVTRVIPSSTVHRLPPVRLLILRRRETPAATLVTNHELTLVADDITTHYVPAIEARAIPLSSLPERPDRLLRPGDCRRRGNVSKVIWHITMSLGCRMPRLVEHDLDVSRQHQARSYSPAFVQWVTSYLDTLPTKLCDGLGDVVTHQR